MLLEDLLLSHLLLVGLVLADFGLFFSSQACGLFAIVDLPAYLILYCECALMTSSFLAVLLLLRLHLFPFLLALHVVNLLRYDLCTRLPLIVIVAHRVFALFLELLHLFSLGDHFVQPFDP